MSKIFTKKYPKVYAQAIIHCSGFQQQQQFNFHREQVRRETEIPFSIQRFSLGFNTSKLWGKELNFVIKMILEYLVLITWKSIWIWLRYKFLQLCFKCLLDSFRNLLLSCSCTVWPRHRSGKGFPEKNVILEHITPIA